MRIKRGQELVLESEHDLILGWEKVEQELLLLAEKIDYRPDLMVGVSRGGLVPAAILSKRFGVEEVQALKVKRTNGERKLLTLLDIDLRGKKILLVDDMAETGKTLKAAKQYLELKGAIVKSACLYTMPITTISPDYFLKMVEEVRKFPWD